MHSTTNHPNATSRTRLRMAALLPVMLVVGACVGLPQTPEGESHLPLGEVAEFTVEAP